MHHPPPPCSLKVWDWVLDGGGMAVMLSRLPSGAAYNLGRPLRDMVQLLVDDELAGGWVWVVVC